MAKIRVLDQNTINRIAAGEVVERPASVIKELVENAIDAGASHIEAEIRNGGITFIRVTDDGCGIASEDVPTAFLPHATSKIRDALDLFGVSSLGFRGEALASIASVAKVELTTKTKDAALGYSCRMEDGEERQSGPAGAPDGTTIIVRDLFGHTPARRKFLRTPQTEAGHIEDLLFHLVLANPSIAFVFINNGQTRLQTSGSGDIKQLITELYGREVGNGLLPVSIRRSCGSVTGYLGAPSAARGSRKFEHYYVNKRYFRDGMVAKAIEEAFRPYLMQHRFPFAVLHITVDPESVDVNVHPGKMEVRFRNRSEVYSLVHDAVSDALLEKTTIPEVSISEPKQEPEPAPLPVHDKKTVQAPPVYRKSDVPEDAEEAKAYFLAQMKKRVTDHYRQAAAEKQFEKPEAKPVPASQVSEQISLFSASEKEASIPASEPVAVPAYSAYTASVRKQFRLIGQLFSTYWLIEYQDQFLLVDQHAAHEKVRYERLMTMLKTEAIPSQMLLPPVIVTLSLSEQTLLREYSEQFSRLGFEIEPFEGNEYALRGVPAMLSGLGEKALFLEMLDDLEEGWKKKPTSQTIEDRIAAMACKAAVKGNQSLSAAEIETLLDELLTLKNPYHCPHGRPTMIVMTRSEIEKKFKRIL